MINIIVAHDKNHVIGINNKMPWIIKKDLEHFKNLTLNHTVIMGKNTYLSIGHPLDKRENIIVSSTMKDDNLIITSSLKEAIKLATNDEIFIIGGSRLYKEALDIADCLYITLIDHEYEGDTYFPEYNLDDYQLIEKVDLKENNLEYHFLKYQKSE